MTVSYSCDPIGISIVLIAVENEHGGNGVVQRGVPWPPASKQVVDLMPKRH